MQKCYISALVAVFLMVALVCGLLPAMAEDSVDYETYSFEWWNTPKSTCFSRIGYDEDEEALALIFRSNETRVYVYSDFSQDDFDTFFAAASLGKYYNKNIKGNYECTRYEMPVRK